MAEEVAELSGDPKGKGSFNKQVFEEALQLLHRGEQAKIDFKREPPDIAKLAKAVAAIANTDDPEGGYYQNQILRDYGFLIIGAEKGKVEGYERLS